YSDIWSGVFFFHSDGCSTKMSSRSVTDSTPRSTSISNTSLPLGVSCAVHARVVLPTPPCPKITQQTPALPRTWDADLGLRPPWGATLATATVAPPRLRAAPACAAR